VPNRVAACSLGVAFGVMGWGAGKHSRREELNWLTLLPKPDYLLLPVGVPLPLPPPPSQQNNLGRNFSYYIRKETVRILTGTWPHLEGFRGLPQCLHANVGRAPRYGHKRFLPIHRSSLGGQTSFSPSRLITVRPSKFQNTPRPIPCTQFPLTNHLRSHLFDHHQRYTWANLMPTSETAPSNQEVQIDHLDKTLSVDFNLLAPELFFLILAHPVYKMWIIQEPNTLELWNKLHFEEKKTIVYTVFKIFSTYICWIYIYIYIKCNFRG